MSLYLDDGKDTLGFYLDTTGSLTIPDTSLQKLSGPTVQLTFESFGNWNSFTTQNEHSTNYLGYRKIRYPMK